MRENQDILGSCNGLLCLRSLIRKKYVRLWNPCTGFTSEWLKIKPAEKSIVTYHGFGYDHVHDKYKALVVLMVVASSEETVTQVCTFGANSWTTVEDFPFPPFPANDWTGRFVSGTLNCIVGVPGTTNRWVILSFDLGKESYGQVSQPDMNGDNLGNPQLQVLRNRLCVCFGHKTTHWDVWLMKEYGVEKSWTRLAMIFHLELRPNETDPPLKPLFMSGNDLVLTRPPFSKLVLYNLYDSQLYYYAKSGGQDEEPLGYFHVYHESLVSASHCGLRLYFTRISSTLDD